MATSYNEKDAGNYAEKLLPYNKEDKNPDPKLNADLFGGSKNPGSKMNRYKKGGSVKSSASSRADGCATKGKTKGRMA